MLVRDYMTKDVFTLRVDKKLVIADELMKWAHVRHVPVVDQDGRLVGIVSHRDLLRASISSIETRVAAAEKRQHLASVTVREVMQAQVQTISPDAPVQEAAKLMRERKIGCLPVVTDGRLIGIITESDLLRIVAQLQPEEPLGNKDRDLTELQDFATTTLLYLGVIDASGHRYEDKLRQLMDAARRGGYSAEH